MNKLLFFACVFFLISNLVTAQNTLTVNDPDRRSYGHTGYISDPVFEVTPQGAYARVDMIFTFNVILGSNTSNQLEVVLNFTLPDGSFIHDSWLWLNDTVIIRADVVEKNRAVEIYEGIVNRRRDPSLLVKTGTNSYQLNVYPITKSYPRKVKLSYSTPMKWRNDEMKLELPTGLLRASKTIPDFALKVNQNPLFGSPSFLIQDYNSLKKGSVGPQDSLRIKAQDIKYSDLTLMYKSSIGNNVLLTKYPTGAAEGVYQLVLPPQAIGKHNNRCLAIVIDMDDNSRKTHSFAEMKNYLRYGLLNNYNEQDSFNVFYVHNSSVVQAFTNWKQVNKSNVNQVFNSMPLSLSKHPILYKPLLVQALQFCATKSKLEAEVLLVSQNYDYTFNQAMVNTMFDDIKKSIGGSYKNKINVLNCSNYSYWNQGTRAYANNIWYSKLTLETGGVSYDYYTNQGVPVVEVSTAISQIARNAGESTSAYSLSFNPINGFTHSEYSLRGLQRLNLSDNHVLIGKYSGDILTGTKVDLQAIFPSGNISKQFTVNNVLTGSNNSIKEWSHLYIEDLIGQNNKSYVQEIIDSSINNRVLCTYTAFLAVETGDTISTNADGNPEWPSSIDPEIAKDKLVLKAYPNPFVNNLTLELPEGALLIEVYDVMGKKIMSHDLSSDEKRFVWNGKTTAGIDVAAGTYIVIVRTETERFTLKVMKK